MPRNIRQQTNPQHTMGSVCCFTGYRPQKLPWGSDESDARCIRVKIELAREILNAYTAGFDRFLSGMAAGIDLLAAEIVLGLQKQLPLHLDAAIPYSGQADYFTWEIKRRYQSVLKNCAHTDILSQQYDQNCMAASNRFMIERSGRVIAVYDGQPGGTKNTLAYARKKEIERVLIHPETGAVTYENMQQSLF